MDPTIGVHFQRSSISCFEKCKASFSHDIPHFSSSFYFLINTWLDHCECHIKDTLLISCQKFFLADDASDPTF